jgi:prepilin peptidase CpaA
MPDYSTTIASLQALLTRPGTGILLTLLVLAAVIDARSYRIPNAITVAGMVLGVLVTMAEGPGMLVGLGRGVAGLALGLIALLPLYVFSIAGAGDVKLMAMVGAFVGVPDVFPALLFVLITGGVMAVFVVVSRGLTRRVVANLVFLLRAATATAITGVRGTDTRMVSAGRLPYAVCICVGTAIFLFVRQAYA